ncbi:MAG: hypothetical protein H6730_07505 [Deltaproteobacteria bacterium]|nr:hypothetical protein [Deltaproteobacteria bacterium]
MARNVIPATPMRAAWLTLTWAVLLAACAPEAEPGVQTAPRALRHGALAAETALLSLVLTPDGKARFDAATRRPIAFAAPAEGGHAAHAADHLLEILHEGRPPVRIPVALGSALDPEDEARSPWAGGGTILRGPCFGPGTRYRLLSASAPDGHALAEIEVRE